MAVRWWLLASWEHPASTEPEVHKLLKCDVYVPPVKNLATFCRALQEREEEEG